eukprot:scaffold3273_cov363-Prasinococcus_capsulatus_cf.AAC.1
MKPQLCALRPRVRCSLGLRAPPALTSLSTDRGAHAPLPADRRAHARGSAASFAAAAEPVGGVRAGSLPGAA